jgi:hypothetical protein
MLIITGGGMSLSTTKYKKTMLGSGARLMCVAALAFGLAGCDYVGGLFAPKSPEEQRDEGVALGAGCRQAGQTLEDCYTRNPKSLKAGIYAGWKEMHEYMAAMNIETAKEVETVDPIKEVLDPSSDKGLAKVNDEAAKARAERDAERERRRQARERRESRQRPAGS